MANEIDEDFDFEFILNHKNSEVYKKWIKL